MKCPTCNTNEVTPHYIYGVISCRDCRRRLQGMSVTKQTHEFTTEEIKEQRKEFADDILQPYRDGHLSKEYIDRYGTKGLDIPQDEIKHADNVWNDDSYYKRE